MIFRDVDTSGVDYTETCVAGGHSSLYTIDHYSRSHKKIIIKLTCDILIRIDVLVFE